MLTILVHVRKYPFESCEALRSKAADRLFLIKEENTQSSHLIVKSERSSV